MATPRRNGSRFAIRHAAQLAMAASLCLFLVGCGGRRNERVSSVPVMAPPPPTVVARPADTTTVIAATPAPAPATVIGAATPAPTSTTVITATPAPGPRTAVVAADVPPAPPPNPSVVVSPPPQPRAPDWDPLDKDRYGFDGDRYLSLVTPEEVDVLRLRSRGDLASHLSRFLSEKEKENLRRRSAELTEIGADPLQVGE